ncbi:glutathione synthetase-like [Clytia hemisphaerica]|uniref:glutathione synthetase-like n=1 Tax=Clytia hemisphaerica TaxID=252671 RepID=UPI0034D7B458
MIEENNNNTETPKTEGYKSLKFSEQEIEDLVKAGKDWQHCNGCLMRNLENEFAVNHTAFVLFPTAFPRQLYDEATLVQKDFQLLYFKASKDYEFIKSSLQRVIIKDEFTRKLFEIYEETRSDLKQKIRVNLNRSDYMINQCKCASNIETNDQRGGYQLRQIEMNMISVGALALSPLVGQTHQYLAEVMGEDSPYQANQIPIHQTHEVLGESLAKAFYKYGNHRAIVLFIIEHTDINTTDQRHLEHAFHRSIRKSGIKHRVPCLFRNLQEIYEKSTLTDDSKLLFEGKEVALCYLRSGYSPNHYSTQERWDARLRIEKSNAIKVPIMSDQLVGTKKVQQVLAEPGMVERFIHDKNAVQRIRKTFAGLYSLDEVWYSSNYHFSSGKKKKNLFNLLLAYLYPKTRLGAEGDQIIEDALKTPSNFVLKPQREGGGNNLYDQEMVDELRRISNDPEERSQYILMERIRPPVVHSYIVRPESLKPMESEIVSELGILGVIMSDGDDIIQNESCGHLLKSKDWQRGEGGLIAGRAGIDSPCLI